MRLLCDCHKIPLGKWQYLRLMKPGAICFPLTQRLGFLKHHTLSFLLLYRGCIRCSISPLPTEGILNSLAQQSTPFTIWPNILFIALSPITLPYKDSTLAEGDIKCTSLKCFSTCNFLKIEIKFTSHKTYHFNNFQVSNLVAFSTFTMWYNHDHYLFQSIFITPKGNPLPMQ